MIEQSGRAGRYCNIGAGRRARLDLIVSLLNNSRPGQNIAWCFQVQVVLYGSIIYKYSNEAAKARVMCQGPARHDEGVGDRQVVEA